MPKGHPGARKTDEEKHTSPHAGRRMMESCSDETNQKILAHSLDVSNMAAEKPLDRENPDEVKERTRAYFELCMLNGMKPTLPEYAMALGTDRSNLLHIVQGHTKLNDISVTYIKQAYDMINGQLEQYMMADKTNVVAGIFLAKNNFGYRDQTEQTVVHTIDVKKSAEQLEAEAQLLLGE